MEAFKTTIQYNEYLFQWLKNLPLKKNQSIEIIIFPSEKEENSGTDKNVNTLNGTVLKYENPFAPAIFDDEWETLK